jgi:hypothetical protein
MVQNKKSIPKRKLTTLAARLFLYAQNHCFLLPKPPFWQKFHDFSGNA